MARVLLLLTASSIGRAGALAPPRAAVARRAPHRHATASADDDGAWMRAAVAEAALAGNGTFPNPRVGCVVVDARGREVGRGFHRKAGEPHAEILALRACGARVERDAADAGAWRVAEAARVAGATAYVTLEPCSHVGRTPPCCDALVAAGVARVVVGMPDPAPWVDGAGVAKLRAAGVAVDVGVEEAACEALNADWLGRVRALPRDDGAA